MNLKFNFDGKTLLRDWWKIVEENFRTIQSVFSDYLNKFNTHKNAAELDHPNKSVTSRKIADKAVGTAQIADYAVGQTQLAQYSVSSAKIYPAAVQTAHIKDGNVTKEKLSEDIQTVISKLIGGDGSVWQNDCDLEWQNNGMEMMGVTYDESSDIANIEFYVGGSLSVNGAYIFDDCMPMTLTIDHEGGDSHEVYKTVQLTIELSTGKVALHLKDKDAAKQDMEAYYSKGFLTVDIGNICVYHERFSPYVSITAYSFPNEYCYSDCFPPLFLPALHKHGTYDIKSDATHRFVSDEEKTKWNSVSDNITALKSSTSVLTQNIQGLESRMVLTANDEASLTTALNAIKDTGGTIKLTNSDEPISMPKISLTTDKQYIIEGENQDVNLVYASEPIIKDNATIVFRNLTVTFASADSRSFVFKNCNISNTATSEFCKNAAANLTFLNCTMVFDFPETIPRDNYSMIQSSGKVIIDNHCEIFINVGYASDGITPTKNVNFIMRCRNAVITNSHLETSGDRFLCNLFVNGKYRITNNTISLTDKDNSLFRVSGVDGDDNILANNQISVNQGTSIRAGIVTSNVFDIPNTQTADNCFKICCDGIITDCLFLDRGVYIDCKDSLCMVKDNYFRSGDFHIINGDESCIIKDNF